MGGEEKNADRERSAAQPNSGDTRVRRLHVPDELAACVNAVQLVASLLMRVSSGHVSTWQKQTARIPSSARFKQRYRGGYIRERAKFWC